MKGIRHKVQLATKFGICYEDGKRAFRGDPSYVRSCCEASLRRLDVDYIDLYYVHRIDSRVPIEVTVNLKASSFLWKERNVWSRVEVPIVLQWLIFVGSRLFLYA